MPPGWQIKWTIHNPSPSNTNSVKIKNSQKGMNYPFTLKNSKLSAHKIEKFTKQNSYFWCHKTLKTVQFLCTVRPATALTSLALNLILHYFELVPELLLQHYFLRFYLPSTALFWHGSWWKEKCQISLCGFLKFFTN